MGWRQGRPEDGVGVLRGANCLGERMCLIHRVREASQKNGEGAFVILTFSDGQLELRTAWMGEDIAHLRHGLPARLPIGACTCLGDRVSRRWW